jgi:ferredoxin
MCTTVCPQGVFAQGEKRAVLIKPEACIECGACQSNCPTAAITVDTNIRFSISILGIARVLLNALDLKALLLPSFSKIRQKLYHSFLFNRRPLNLYFAMIEEIVLSLMISHEYFYCECGDSSEREPTYSSKQLIPILHNLRPILEKEFIYLSNHFDLSKIDKVIVVGAGAIPYTAIYFSKKIHKPVYAIEKNILAYIACLKLLRRLKINTIKVVKGTGQLYQDYAKNSLVIITLHTLSKQMVLERVKGNAKYNGIVVIRQPPAHKIREFESVTLDGLKYTTIEHDDGVSSFIISNQFPQKRQIQYSQKP